jgi:rhodanese-related sulfurtransferase
MKKGLFLFGLLAIIGISCQNSSKTTEETSKNNKEQGQPATATLLSAPNFIAKLKGNPEAQLIDVRTPEEVAQGALDNAVNINIYDADFKDKLNKLDKNKALFVYCRSGGRSGQCVQMCKAMGFKEIYDMQGGWLSYSRGN